MLGFIQASACYRIQFGNMSKLKGLSGFLASYFYDEHWQDLLESAIKRLTPEEVEELLQIVDDDPDLTSGVKFAVRVKILEYRNPD